MSTISQGYRADLTFQSLGLQFFSLNSAIHYRQYGAASHSKEENADLNYAPRSSFVSWNSLSKIGIPGVNSVLLIETLFLAFLWGGGE